MTLSLNDVLDALQLAALVSLLYVLTKPTRFTTSQRDTMRIAASTALILTGTLHLALRFHLIV
ncbi:hypothetical protein C8J47_2072 [Sphingomonas sp. PP-F2F-G114-C0414]|uniref:hypothetical protein n=1 Tax=Sphingomonas sp. PP-F2F-G114-C0414 TaxID=2135662 RepID=UPI000F229BE6|nr:hypothetical protein [Sphingomonas sp. PP-F2F-G114-C0414]RMB34349.1 hypothetical protein C8J47_2072 [Sphingomonas sp. PP-F2F-G114-C0414]